MTQSLTGRMINGFDIADADELDASSRDLVERRGRVLSTGYKLLYARPLHFVRGEGRYLIDADGHPYFDAYNNVTSLGHCHPVVVDAVTRQVAKLNTNTRYLHEGLVDYAERLADTHDRALTRAIFTCTGSESIDLALRIARTATGKPGVVVTENAYHGMTMAAAEISPSLGTGVPLGAHVRVVPAPARGATASEVGRQLARAVAAAAADLERHGIGFGAFVADSLFSSDGLAPEPAGFLREVRNVVRDAGGLYIADEVQPGFARTGDAMWGYQRHGIVPDVVAMGKPMGNGLPIAGVVATDAALDDFGRNARYFNTFGGNTVSIAAAAAVLSVIEEDGLLENSRVVGARLLDRLRVTAARTVMLGDVRGAGLYLGVDVVDALGQPDGERALDIVNRLRERRFLISAMGPHGSVLKIRPPLTTTADEADELNDALADVLDEITGGR
ncbi:aspartate aminotransferase family protein [Amycolatopsis acidicola]|uniref:Aspartate aminotransferase family protein n=1 Tax=Amycolatopsis acidicola TaxID=2596893 RepID=A0A5N0VG67_9PSEU|nr:aspartate aminotransferase family protein [Amycolatopsis acidicola]KAA9164383.1 aspartate aminotransferase family protein [Amycolatopsis acidicola]